MKGQLEAFVRAFLDDLPEPADFEGAHVRLELGTASWSSWVLFTKDVGDLVEKLTRQAQAHAADLGVRKSLPAKLVAFSDVDPQNRRTLAFTMVPRS